MLAGIIGNAISNSRIRGSNPSATGPFGSRSYFGGPSDRSAARTVFRDTSLIRAICLIGMPSARWSRLISAQSSTSITCFLPDPIRIRISGRGVKIRLPRRGEYSASADSEGAGAGCLLAGVLRSRAVLRDSGRGWRGRCRPRGDGGEGDGLAGCPFGASLLGLIEVARAAYPA
jgi:hypothetical protein